MTDNIYTKLAAIQQKLCVPKTRGGKGGISYKYRNCDDIMEGVKPLLGNAVLYMSDEMVAVGDRIYVKATATFTDGTASIVNTAFAREAADPKGMSMAQLTGATSSYARKYALAGLLCLDDEQDDDVDAGERSAPKPKQAAPAKAKEPAAPALQLPYANSKGEVVMQPTLEAWVAAFTKFVAAKGMAAVEANRATMNKVIEMIPEASAQLNAIITKAEDEDRIRRNPLNAG